MNRRMLSMAAVAILAPLWALMPAFAQPQPPDPPPPAPTSTPDLTPAAVLPTTPEVAPGDQAAPSPPEPEPEEPAHEDARPQLHRNFAGSIQLDYMMLATQNTGRKIALDGATAEVSLKLAMDFSNSVSANVKVCVACHGLEAGMAYFDLRVADELNFRVGRFTPSFGEYPLRHDPANHRTSDNPLAYDMGRMLRISEWNEGVMPAPWVDNGVEVNGTHFFGDHVQVDYALYAVGGPRAPANPRDFDFKQSRSGESYYIDNNSRPSIGGQIVGSLVGDHTVSLGFSMMRGTYDPDHRLPYLVWGAHTALRINDLFVRAEYLNRRTKMYIGDTPEMDLKYGPGQDGVYDPFFVKDGGYVEAEVPIGRRLIAVLREDGIRRRGNTVATSALRATSGILRHTAAVAIVLRQSLRLKLSYEYYDFSDFSDESVIHVGIAGPF